LPSVDVGELAENLSVVVSNLCHRRNISSRRKEAAYKEYLENIAKLYVDYAYLPQVYPVFAINFNYHSPKSFNRIYSNLENIYNILSDIIGDISPKTPEGIITLTVVGTIVLCVEASRGYTPDAEFEIGSAKVGVSGYCSLMRHAHRSSLILASNKFMDYALEFVVEALSNFINKTKIESCRKCSNFTLTRSLKGISRFRSSCPDCYEGFRRELTSRILTSFRGLLFSLYGLKWMYNSEHLLGNELEGVVLPVERKGRGGGGLRNNYAVVPTYLGRLIAQAIEVWSGRIPDYEAFRGVARVVKEYVDVYEEFRREARRINKGITPVSIYMSESVSKWHASVVRTIQELPILSLVVHTGLGEISDDLVNFAVNERVHSIAASFYSPLVYSSFQWFSALDFESLLVNRVLREVRVG